MILLLAALGNAGGGCYSRIGQSLQAYHRSYRALDGEGIRLNSLDRLILAVMLAETKPAK